jgi:hypothetical protein
MLTPAQIWKLPLGSASANGLRGLGVRPAVSEPSTCVCQSDTARRKIQLVEEGFQRAKCRTWFWRGTGSTHGSLLMSPESFTQQSL